MGWTTTYKPKGEPVLDFFMRNGVLRWGDDNPNTYRVLDSALVNMSTFYAAVEQVNKATGERRVWAAVILVRFGRDPYNRDNNFSWKDMDETMGPCESHCPERILKLLTPTDNEYALGWRKACWANIEKRKARKNLPVGTVLKYGKYVLTIEGPAYQPRRLSVRDQHGTLWTLTHSQVFASEIVSQPEPAHAPANT